MPSNTVVIGGCITDKVKIVMNGKLVEQYIFGLRRYVLRAEGVDEAAFFVVDGKPVIVATCKLINEDDTTEQIRIRIRNRCRDWFHDVTGQMTNTDNCGNYVDLLEDAEPVAR